MDSSFALGLAQDLMMSLTPEEAREHSFLHYHTPGLHYLCLLRSPRLTVKLYLASPHLVNSGPEGTDWLVHPHDHAYDFTTFVVAGRADNILLRPKVEGDRAPSKDWHRRLYVPAERTFGPAEAAYPYTEERKSYSGGEGYSLRSYMIHTIAIRPGTALLLFQHADKETQTSLYVRDPAHVPLMDGLYEKPGIATTRLLMAQGFRALQRGVLE